MLCPWDQKPWLVLVLTCLLGYQQEINTWISTCLCRPRWLGLGHLGLGYVSGISQKEKPAAWAQSSHHLLSLGKLFSWGASEAMRLCRDTQIPR